VTDTGGSVVGRETVWSLVFADYLVIVAKSERETKEMMKSMGQYVRKKRLEVNVEKTKMMVFKEKKGRVERMSGNGKEGKYNK
jgi:predicted nucleotidyltransferase